MVAEERPDVSMRHTRSMLKEKEKHMGRTWTPAQNKAIRTQGRTLLISAAAGSGKTATLTERIIRRLTDSTHPAELSRLLVVTFTRAAAAELRDRIGQALSDAIAADPGNHHLRRQLLGLSSAHISTIDSFIREPVKAHFAELNLSAKTRIADEAELLPLSERVMGELMTEFYEKYAPAAGEGLFSLLADNPFADLCDSLTPSKNDNDLLPAFRALYERLLAFPAGIHRLNTEADELEALADGDFFSSSHGGFLRDWLKEFLSSSEAFLSDALDTLQWDDAAERAYGKAFAADLAFIRRLAAAETYAEVYALVASYEKPRVSKLSDASPAMVALRLRRAEIAKTLENLSKTYFSEPPAVLATQMRDTARMCRVLCDFLFAYDERILAEKQARGICDFTDNRRYLLRLLRDEQGQPTPIARELEAQYDEVYIDEYQDVDEMQDEIFRLVGGNHRFMVGDLKQSIYVFRGADPSVFSRYRRELPILNEREENPSGNSIFMSENFRCDESVIRVTNAVCGHILRACPDSIGYRAEDDLGFSKRLPTADYQSVPVEITIIKKPGKADKGDFSSGADEGEDTDGMSAAETEAIYVANRIAAMLRAGDRLANGDPIRPRDIAILMRTGKSLAVYRERLTALGIPTGSDELDAEEAGRDILHGGDMMYLLNLLRVLDDPDSDIPLSETLRAPFPGLTLEDLLTLRRADGVSAADSLYQCLETYADTPDADSLLSAKATEFIEWVEHYRALCATQSAQGILRFLSRDERVVCRETDAFRYLYDAARTCRTSSFVSLYAFLRFFEKKLLTTKNAASAAKDEGEDGHVTLMTIHGSKGLEFPVCFIVRAGDPFSARSTQRDLIFEKRTGLSMKLYRRGSNAFSEQASIQSQAKQETTLRRVGALAIQQSEREEEMRLLYVAMTRARERLLIVGMGTADMTEDAVLGFAAGDRHATMSCNKYLLWVLAGLEAHPEVSHFYRLNWVFTPDVIPDTPLPRRRTQEAGAVDAQTLHFRSIPQKHTPPTSMEMLLGRVPTKIPASRMKENLLDSCVFYDTDLPAETDGKLPTSTEEGSWCDALSESAIRESLRLLSSGDGDELREFELLLEQNRRPTAAEKGTAAHLFLQFSDYNRVERDGLEEEIARLCEQGYINARTAEVLDRQALQGFFDSHFMAHIRTAASVERELKFHRFVPLASLTANAAFAEALGERTLYVQGSIDLLATFPDGHMELCDYKTDHITPAERQDASLLVARMKERHGDQLRQYAAAITEMYGVRPTKVYIFSLPLGEAVEIPI